MGAILGSHSRSRAIGRYGALVDCLFQCLPTSGAGSCPIHLAPQPAYQLYAGCVRGRDIGHRFGALCHRPCGYIGGARDPAVLPDPDLVDHYRDDLAVRAGHGAAYSGDSMRVIGMFFIAQDGPRLQRVNQRR